MPRPLVLAAVAFLVSTAGAAPPLPEVETITAPADWREWPLDPSDRPDRADPRNRIDPATVPANPAFPGAEGHGALATGGRGGRVIKVTTLAAKGPGSLDEALNAKGPRIVVFDVSGVIRGNFVINEPDLTVAGQTAPGAGITIEGTLYTRFAKTANVGNVILRFLRVRVPPIPAMSSETLDGVRILGANRAIVDHVSASWAADEVTGSPESVNVTYQWCSVEESAIQGHREGLHNYGMKGAGYPWGFIHHNLMAHHSNRTPSATAHVINNVAYDIRRGFVMDQPPPPPDLFYASNLIGNYYKAGPSEPNMMPILLKKNTAYFAADNFIHGVGIIGDLWRDAHLYPGLRLNVGIGKRLTQPRPYPYFPITIHSSQRAYELVLAHAGCLPRDRVSRRTIEEVKTGTGKWGRNAPDTLTDEWFLEGLQPGSPPPDADADGMPDAWETSHSLNPQDATDASKVVPRGASTNDRHAGYTFLEYHINDLADRLVWKAMQDAKVKPELPGQMP
ncbi:MAG: pectate lyase precursor [Prosthecobacter sp.]|jgi:pectate lyase|uniref:hypothetical protein n=1 Tax=Prosthecobacter sp. TaxID=1965333 RepID=UPI0019F8B91B|nr:hypothetical protein [Prosthecobacter sp.]MBE2283778.1 pectate lyase precursor [Prosthecobacter sp.]